MTLTLLAVDDSKTMRKVLEITFAGEDVRTLLAPSPNAALALLRSDKPTVALVDALLGEANGYDLAQRIKAESPGTGVIILSSKQHPYDRVRGQAAGADDFVDKPFDTQVMIDKVNAVAQKMAAAPVRAPAAAVPVRAPAAAAPAPVAQPAPVARPSAPMAPVAHPPVARPAAPVAQPVAAAAAPAPTAGIKQSTLSFGSPIPPSVAPKPAVAPSTHQPAEPVVALTTPKAAPAGVVAAALADPSLEGKLAALGLTRDQMAGVLALSREVVEQVVWEVVPVLAETMIREEIQRLTAQ